MPNVAPYVIEVATNPVSWLSIIILGMSASLWSNKKRDRDAVVQPPSYAGGPNTLPNAIRVEFKLVASSFPEEEFATGLIRRSVKVLLKNEGNGWLTGCLLEIASIAPIPTAGQPHPLKALAPSCDLAFGMDRSFILAGYNRAPLATGQHQPQYNDGPTIFYSAPGAYGGGATTILSPDTKYLVRLRASANESKPHDLAHLIHGTVRNRNII